MFSLLNKTVWLHLFTSVALLASLIVLFKFAYKPNSRRESGSRILQLFDEFTKLINNPYHNLYKTCIKLPLQLNAVTSIKQCTNQPLWNQLYVFLRILTVTSDNTILTFWAHAKRKVYMLNCKFKKPKSTCGKSEDYSY